MADITKHIYCPISHQIFFNPVTACDGITYEKSELDKWFKDHDTSPITNFQIVKTYNKNILIKQIIESILIDKPELRKDVFSLHLEANKVEDVMADNYTSVSLKKLSDDQLVQLSRVITKSIIDKIDNLEYIYYDNWKLIHYLCQFSSPDVIKHLVNKDVDLEHPTNKGKRCIEFLIRHSVFEIIKYVIEKGIDIEYEDGCWRLIHYVCAVASDEIIKYFVDKGVNLECITRNDQQKPIHLLCKRASFETIKYVVDKGVDLECVDSKLMKPIHHVCGRLHPEMLKYFVDKGVDLECVDHELTRPIHVVCSKPNLDMLKCLVDKKVALNCKTVHGNKPMIYIARYGDYEMIKYMIDHGAIVDEIAMKIICACNMKAIKLITNKENIKFIFSLIIENKITCEHIIMEYLKEHSL